MIHATKDELKTWLLEHPKTKAYLSSKFSPDNSDFFDVYSFYHKVPNQCHMRAQDQYFNQGKYLKIFSFFEFLVLEKSHLYRHSKMAEVYPLAGPTINYLHLSNLLLLRIIFRPSATQTSYPFSVSLLSPARL